MNFEKINKEALALLSVGRLSDAKKLYLKLYRAMPGHPKILLNLGAIELQLKNFQEGILFLEKSILIEPNQPAALCNLANGYLEVGDYFNALKNYDKSISYNSNYEEAYYNRARALTKMNKFNDALIDYEILTSKNKKHFFAYINKGYIYFLLTKYTEAIESYDRAIQINPNYAEAYNNKGLAFQELKKYTEAIESYDRAIQINPNYADAYNNKGISLQELTKYTEAIESYDRAIQINPNYAEAYNNKGLAFQELKKYTEAIESYDRAIQINPNYADAYNNKGISLQELTKYTEAIESYDRAIQINPNYAEAYNNKGLAFQELKKYTEAIESYEQAISINPEYIDAPYNLAILNLRSKNFGKAWNLYEKRFQTKGFIKDNFFKNFNILDGLDVIGKKILLIREQGLGDQILFLSMLSDFKKLGCKITVMIDYRLIPIFERSFCEITFISSLEQLEGQIYDYYLPLGSLGKFLRNDINLFDKKNKKYLNSDTTQTKIIRKSLEQNDKLICGISWRSQNAKTSKAKSINLEKLVPILKIENLVFVDLQYGDVEEEKKYIEKNFNITIKKIKEIDYFYNIDGLTSIIDACDFVVTSSNIVAHISGALDKETYVLAPYSSGRIWYWHENDSKSLWYPSVNVCQQHSDNSWDDVIKELSLVLKVKK